MRLGLSIIRGLVRLKAIFIALFGLVLSIFRPAWETVLRFLILPIYRLSYGARRRLGNFYRPAKNRLMFVLTNRYAVHIVVIAIAVVAGTVNFNLGEVRAESDAFGQRSILYSIVTKQEVEVIEEYANIEDVTDYATVTSFADDSLHAPIGGTTLLEPQTSMTGLSQSGLALASPIDTHGNGLISMAPRTSTEKYTVTTGDTLSTISQKFGISLNTLLWANGMTVRSVIKPGMELTILPVTGVSHTVKNGDTLSAIAKKYNVATDTILSFNGLSADDSLKVGQSLVVPGGEITAPIPVARTVAVKDIFTTAPAGSSGATKPTGSAKMVWPTDLHYIVRGLSWFHTGMDVDCSGRADGTSTNDNYAAMDGIVQFSGAKGGYGYAVEINHGNGLVTRYGHFHSLYVQKGDTVTAGTPLGRCGSTGNSTGTHLHFEVIANGKFMNPADYLSY
ncbi:MAG: Peptidase [Patescibacteria group bacterium]|nr:Peptidase [Patescibacteria group bacterium]